VTPLYPQKLALTSPTGGGRSVGIVRVRTKATEFSLVIEKQVCTVCQGTNYKIVPLTNLNEYLHKGKSGIKANINTSSEKVQNITENYIHVHH